MDYLCAKFGDFTFSAFGFIVRTDRITHRQNQSQRLINVILWATTVGVSNKQYLDLNINK